MAPSDSAAALWDTPALFPLSPAVLAAAPRELAVPADEPFSEMAPVIRPLADARPTDRPRWADAMRIEAAAVALP
jgi:hypothetical protein